MRYAIFPILFATLASGGCQMTTLFPRPPSPASELPREAFAAEPVPPGERYYVLLFGSESEPKRAVRTHTFGTVVRVDPSGAIAEVVTISWMPRTLDIRPFRFTVEPAVNLTLDETLAMVERNGESTTLFGPHEITPTLFRRLRLQAQYLEGYTIGYQGFDLVGEAGLKGNGSNCIHAITDADADYGRAGYLLAGNGVHASRFIHRQVRRRGGYINPDVTHDWLLAALGLDPGRFRRE